MLEQPKKPKVILTTELDGNIIHVRPASSEASVTVTVFSPRGGEQMETKTEVSPAARLGLGFGIRDIVSVKKAAINLVDKELSRAVNYGRDRERR